ncbi:hypothetical protein JCM3770_005428 [Rhodotorula araucariae]
MASPAATPSKLPEFDPLEGYTRTSNPPDPPDQPAELAHSAPRPAITTQKRSSMSTRTDPHGHERQETMGWGDQWNGAGRKGSTASSASRRNSGAPGRPRSMQPPKDPDLFDSDEAFRAQADAEKASGWHHLPLILVGLPPLGAIVHGRAENWSDAIILALVVFYLYQLIKVPWELYYSSYARYVLPSGVEPGASEDPAIVAERKRSARALRRNELVSLALTFLVPVLGASVLHYARGLLSDPDRFINRFLIGLFAIASSVKPLLHFVKLVKRNSLYHQEVVHYPSSQVHQLQQRVDRLEQELTHLARTSVPLSTFQTLSTSLSSTLTPLQRQLRRQTLEAQHAQLSASERLAALTSAVDDLCLAFQAQEDDLGALREVVAARGRTHRPHPATAFGLVRILGSVAKHLVLYLAAHPASPGGGGAHHGVAWYALWPLTVPRALLGWAVSGTAQGAVRALGWEEDAAALGLDAGVGGGKGGRSAAGRRTMAITPPPPARGMAVEADDDEVVSEGDGDGDGDGDDVVYSRARAPVLSAAAAQAAPRAAVRAAPRRVVPGVGAARRVGGAAGAGVGVSGRRAAGVAAGA